MFSIKKAKYSALFDYLIFLKSKYGIQVNIYDIYGFLSADVEFGDVFHPFSIHNNKYCMYVKSDPNANNNCLKKRKNIMEKCIKSGGIYHGMCYAGVEEYVMPVFSGGELIAMLFAGAFRCNTVKAFSRMKKLSRNYDLIYEKLLQNYYEGLLPDPPSLQEIKPLVQIAAQYIEYIHSDLHSSMPIEAQNSGGTNYILIRALDYINTNYKKAIYISDVAKFCHCSESYISHIFKMKINSTINQHINKLRIHKAKRYLEETEMPVKNIADELGYTDPNYFSKVFKDFCGVYPTKYKKEYSKTSVR